MARRVSDIFICPNDEVFEMLCFFLKCATDINGRYSFEQNVMFLEIFDLTYHEHIIILPYNNNFHFN